MSTLDEDTQLSSSSDEESESNNDSKKDGLNLAGFLFGNIDRDGHLEENFLDETSKKKLGGLSSMLGLGNIIQDEVKNAESSVKIEDYEEGNKAPDAEDFSAINDALTDDSNSSSSDDEKDDKNETTSEETDIKKEPSLPAEPVKTEISEYFAKLSLFPIVPILKQKM